VSNTRDRLGFPSWAHVALIFGPTDVGGVSCGVVHPTRRYRGGRGGDLSTRESDLQPATTDVSRVVLPRGHQSRAATSHGPMDQCRPFKNTKAEIKTYICALLFLYKYH
jgi:hypothetical protein